jgi:exodeoxyribonuclease V
MPKNITLTDDQKAAVKAFLRFLVNPDEKYMIIHGSAGTGKSTLITYLMEALERQYKMYALLLCKQPKNGEFQVHLSAVTNKAAAVMKELTGRDAVTVNTLLNVVPKANFETGYRDLVKTKNYTLLHNRLILLDEASMLSDELFNLLDETTIDSKIVLIGDQYQLAPVKQQKSLMESLTCPKVTMNKVMRHAGDILTTSALFREVVETKQFKEIPTSQDVQHVNGLDFKDWIDRAFTGPGYRSHNTKILAWTNGRVIEYNNYVRELKCLPERFEAGETVITNNFIQIGRHAWGVDSSIKLTDIGPVEKLYGVKGCMVELDETAEAFWPFDYRQAKTLMKACAKAKEWRNYFMIKDQWLDLRPVYASTVHKSQGSTYDTVFIDLSDIGRCTIASDVARMLYVALSRSRKQVVLYGSLPQRYQELPVGAAVA